MTQPSPVSAAPGRISRLDGLRGIAALVVALYHGRLLFTPAAVADVWPPLDMLFDWGWTCVDLFFVISGYIFAHAYGRPGQLAAPGALRGFAVARIARLYPLHLVMLLVCAFLFAGKPGSDATAFLAHLLMLQALVSPFADTFDGPSWSLTVECLCYAVFALAAAGGRRIWLAVIVGAIGWGALDLALHGQPGGPWADGLFSRGLLGFFAGQALWQGRTRVARVPSTGLIAIAALGFALALGPWSPLPALGLLAWPALVALALRLPLLESRPALWLGDRSYAIYLIHMPVIEFAAKRFGPFGPAPAELIVASLAVALLTGLLADAALRRVENPARRAIRRAWQARPRRMAPA